MSCCEGACFSVLERRERREARLRSRKSGHGSSAEARTLCDSSTLAVTMAEGEADEGRGQVVATFSERRVSRRSQELELLRSIAGSRSSCSVPQTEWDRLMHIGKERQDAEDETSEWMNVLLRTLWPSISKHMENVLQEEILPALQEAVGFHGLHVREFKPGQSPWQIHNLHARECTRVTAKGDVAGVVMNLDVVYLGDASFSFGALGAAFGFSNIRLLGSLVVQMPELLPRPPFFSGMAMYFPDMPFLEMEFNGLAKILDMKVLHERVKQLVLQQISAETVLPNQMGVKCDDDADVFHFRRMLPEALMKISVGQIRWTEATAEEGLNVVLHVGLQEFRVCPKPPRHNVLQRLASHEFQSETLQCDFEVSSSEEQHLVVEVFRVDMSNEIFGEARVPLRTLKRVHGEVCVKLHRKAGLCEVGLQIQLDVTWRKFLLDPVLLREIPKGSEVTTCALYVGVYSAVGLPVVQGHSYWCDVIVRDFNDAILEERTTLPIVKAATCIACGNVYMSDALFCRKCGHKREDVVGVSNAPEANCATIARRLHERGVQLETIAESLQCSVDLVTEYIHREDEDQKVGNVCEAQWEEAFVFMLRDPRASYLDFHVHSGVEIGKGNALGQARYDVVGLMERPRNTETATLTLRSLNASVTAKLQLRALVAPEQTSLKNMWSMQYVDGGRSSIAPVCGKDETPGNIPIRLNRRSQTPRDPGFREFLSCCMSRASEKTPRVSDDAGIA